MVFWQGVNLDCIKKPYVTMAYKNQSLKVDNPESTLKLLSLSSFPALAYVLDECS